MAENTKIFITQSTQKRLISDIRELMKNPLTDQGIYYAHDESDMLKGFGMIIGPSDTIYSDGFFLFEFIFPYNYPFSPPRLKFKTSDGYTRFHPNLYRNGKVCLSLLNTWKGEQWTACQTIRSILLTLLTLFHNKPLLNEPGFTEKSHDFIPYNQIIKYNNYKCAILNMINQKYLPISFLPFYIFMKKHFIQHYKEIELRIEKEKQEMPTKQEFMVSVYNLKIIVNYPKLLEDITQLNQLINIKLK